MKSPLAKLRNIGLHKAETKGKWDQKISLPVDGLNQAAKDMKDMRTCYDSLLSAAAATANSAYEFSESLLEMGNCLLEKTAMHDNGESRGTLSMLGKVQLELQKLVDVYRSHIIMTITNPSECLLSELRKVEEMKLQCDEKREMFEYMVGQFREKGKSRHGKGETFSSQQLQVVCEEYDDAARLCIFRVESLKQGQSRSLLTQAARHHAAQLNFFRKGFHSLEAVESHVRSVAEKQHIDYELSEPNEAEKDDEGNSNESNYYGEISFDYRHDEQELGNAGTTGNSMELDQLGAPSAQTSKVRDVEVQINSSKNQGDQILSQQRWAGSHSAPIYAEKLDIADKIREMRTAVPKFNTHVLPTPSDAKGSIANSSTSTPSSSTLLSLGSSKNLWHSSPLDIEKPKRFMDEQLSTRPFSKSQISVEENSSNKHSLPLPPPLTEGVAVPQVDTQSGTDLTRNKRQAFSGPIASRPSANKPMLPSSGPIELPQSVSGLLSRVSGPQPPSLVNVSHNASAGLATSPRISELHELPRPPDSFRTIPMRSSMRTLGHSAPLVHGNREVSPTNRNPIRQSKEGSPLPLPQLTVSRSFSIPSSSQRAAAFHSGKLLESSQVLESREEVISPPLTPLSLLNMKSPNSGQIRVNAGGS